jgi:hypothetical protein
MRGSGRDLTADVLREAQAAGQDVLLVIGPAGNYLGWRFVPRLSPSGGEKNRDLK